MLMHWLLAGMAVLAVAARPRSWRSALLAATAATLDVALQGAAAVPAALRVALPTFGFLALAVGIAVWAVRVGAVQVTAGALARAADGRPWRLFGLVCCLTAALTAVVSLDGAVVVMAPVVVELRRRLGAPVRPLLLGVVAVANGFSLAVPEGNPTNLVVVQHLGLSIADTVTRTAAPAVAATVVCAGAVAWRERRSLGGAAQEREPQPAVPRLASGLAGVARVGVQVTALLVCLLPLAAGTRFAAGSGLGPLVAVSLVTAAAAAIANNLPASAVVASWLAPGPAAYAAIVGLSVGALATPQGSVATLIAGDLAGSEPYTRALAPAAAASVLAATLLVWVT